MQFLKNLPIGYKALLKDIRLINFSVDEKELARVLPRLPLVRINNRPIISMLDVKLYQLTPSWLFTPFRFNYRHIAFRVLIKDDTIHQDGINRGIYYLHSFTDNSFVVKCGKMFTNFNFRYARISDADNSFELRYGEKWLNYQIRFNEPTHPNGLMQSLMQIDRAYSVNGNNLKFTKVRRADLPLTPLSCSFFSTNFFNTARFIDAYYVGIELDYEWLPARQCTLAG